MSWSAAWPGGFDRLVEEGQLRIHRQLVEDVDLVVDVLERLELLALGLAGQFRLGPALRVEAFLHHRQQRQGHGGVPRFVPVHRIDGQAERDQRFLVLRAVGGRHQVAQALAGGQFRTLEDRRGVAGGIPELDLGNQLVG